MGDDRDQAPHEEPTEGDKKRLVDRVVPELVKRLLEGAVERAGEKLADNSENLRHFVGEMKLPKELLHYLYMQIDDTKNDLYRLVAKEIRDVLDQTKFADEITKVLTKLSFEIKTEIRFVPNTANASRQREGAGEDTDESQDDEVAGLPRPEISSQVSVRDQSKQPRRDRKKREGT